MQRHQKDPITFVGPIIANTRAGLTHFSFSVLQDPSGPFTLTYQELEDANQSRQDLLNQERVYPIENTEVLSAIGEAMREVQHNHPRPSDEIPDNTPPPDTPRSSDRSTGSTAYHPEHPREGQ